jgi:molybdate transport system ATP-binding protein
MRLSFRARHTFESGFVLDASFAVGDGVTALSGASGNGKSTVLAILAGTLRPDDATVVLEGRTLVDTRRGVFLAPEARGVGFVFQDHLLFPHMSVEANLRYGLARKPLRPIAFRRVAELLEIGDLLDRMPDTLSGGQRQRVALGRALLRGPSLLLLDEPLTGLDAGLKQRIFCDLERIFDEGKIPPLFVSHDAADVGRLAAHIVTLSAGRVVPPGAGAARALGAALEVA